MFEGRLTILHLNFSTFPGRARIRMLASKQRNAKICIKNSKVLIKIRKLRLRVQEKTVAPRSEINFKAYFAVLSNYIRLEVGRRIKNVLGMESNY